VRVSLVEELRMLDYGQRLPLRRRSPLVPAGGSSGRVLFDGAARGSGAAIGRDAGRIEVGALADLVALDGSHIALAGLTGDTLLDAHVFSGDDRAVRDVWSAGRRVVRDGQHVAREQIAPRFAACLKRLREGK
jgi:formimidoylglutamate deiminase